MDMHQRLQHRELGAHLYPSRTFNMPTELDLEELVMSIVLSLNNPAARYCWMLLYFPNICL